MKSRYAVWLRHLVWGLLALVLSGWPVMFVMIIKEFGFLPWNFVAACPPMFASGWLLSKFGQNRTARILVLAVFPLHTFLMMSGIATLLHNLPPWMAWLVYLLSIPALTALACVTVLRLQRAIAGRKPSPP